MREEEDDPKLQDEFINPMNQRCIGFICTLATELPWKEDSNIRTRRGIVHALVAGERGVCTHSTLEHAVGQGGRRKTTLGSDVLESVISELTKKETTSLNTTVFRLKDEYLKEYDPCFLHLQTRQHQHAHQYIRDRSKGKSVFRHEPPSLRHALAPFRGIRGEILLCPAVLLMIKYALDAYVLCSFIYSLSQSVSHTHTHSPPPPPPPNSYIKQETDDTGDGIALSATHWLSLTAYFLENECENRERATLFWIAFCGRESKQDSCLEMFEIAKREADKVGDSEVAESIGSLLRDMHRLEERWTGGLYQLRFDADLIGDDNDEKVDEEKRAAMSAQERAMAAIAAQQSKFAEMMDLSDSSEESDDDDDDNEDEDEDEAFEDADDGTTSTKEEETEEEDVCVMCRSSTSSNGNDLLGFVGFVQVLDKIPYLTFCGHLLHMSCRDKYQASLIQQRMQDPFQQLRSSNVENGEFTCPLCKTLSNTIVPCTKHTSSTTTTFEVMPGLNKEMGDSWSKWLTSWHDDECTFEPGDKVLTSDADFNTEQLKSHDFNCLTSLVKDLYNKDDDEEDAARSSLNPDNLVHHASRALAKCFDTLPPSKRSEGAIRSLSNVRLCCSFSLYFYDINTHTHTHTLH